MGLSGPPPSPKLSFFVHEKDSPWAAESWTILMLSDSPPHRFYFIKTYYYFAKDDAVHIPTDEYSEAAAVTTCVLCIGRRNPHTRKTTTPIFIVVILNIIQPTMKLTCVYYLIQSSNTQIHSKLGRTLKMARLNRSNWQEEKLGPEEGGGHSRSHS